MDAPWYGLANLMQGLVGAIVGSVVAAGVAIYTVRQTFRAEREGMREARRVAAVEAVYGPLLVVSQALSVYRDSLGEEVLDAEMDGELWRGLDLFGKIDEFRDTYRLQEPILRGDFGELLSKVDKVLFGIAMAAKYDREDRGPSLARTDKAHIAVESALVLLREYLGDPPAVAQRLARMAQRQNGRERRRMLWRALRQRSGADRLSELRRERRSSDA